jgi:hypothetical protein
MIAYLAANLIIYNDVLDDFRVFLTLEIIYVRFYISRSQILKS